MSWPSALLAVVALAPAHAPQNPLVEGLRQFQDFFQAMDRWAIDEANRIKRRRLIPTVTVLASDLSVLKARSDLALQLLDSKHSQTSDVQRGLVSMVSAFSRTQSTIQDLQQTWNGLGGAEFGQEVWAGILDRQTALQTIETLVGVPLLNPTSAAIDPERLKRVRPEVRRSLVDARRIATEMRRITSRYLKKLQE